MDVVGGIHLASGVEVKMVSGIDDNKVLGRSYLRSASLKNSARIVLCRRSTRWWWASGCG